MAELIISVANLLEAEGRALRRAVFRAKMGLEFLWVASVLFLGGIGLCLWAVYQGLNSYWGSITAALITGFITLFLSGGLACIIIRINR